MSDSVASRRGLVLVLSLIAVAVLVSIAGVLFLTLLFGGTALPPIVRPTPRCTSKLRAPLERSRAAETLFSAFTPHVPTLRETIDMIKRAKADDRIKTLVILPQSGAGLWAQLEEVRAALVDFKTSGKSITAYLESGGAQEYYLATAADHILLMPAGGLDLTGITTYELFFRGALDKLGVYPDLLHIGDYKTASNTFTERTFTPAHLEEDRSFTDSWYSQLVKAIADGRGRTDAEVQAAINGGPYLADGARQAGLVDRLAYEDQIDDQEPVSGTTRFDADAYGNVPAISVATAPADERIAVVYATGTIASGTSTPESGVLGSETFAAWIRKVRVDTSIRAIVVRIDSPGGSAIASEAMWRELMLARDVKPLIVSMGDLAASGGYYIALPGQVIVAEPGTLTGSVGVVTGKFAVGGLMDKLGIGTGSVSDGQFAEMNSPFKAYTPEERARVQDQIQSTYETFVSRVADSRHMTPAKVDTIAQGRVWTGSQARELNLVDEIGGLDAALRIAQQRARMDVNKRPNLVIYPQRRSVYEILANPLGMTFGARLGLTVNRPELQAIDRLTLAARLFRPSEPLMLMPSVVWTN